MVHGEDWKKRLRVTLSLSDGAPARISAINASMRSYRPDYLHIWRTKTFWDQRILSEEDVEFHTFKKLEMRPATYITTLAPTERKLAEDMISYKRQFEAVRQHLDALTSLRFLPHRRTAAPHHLSIALHDCIP